MEMQNQEMLSELDQYIALCKDRLKNILSTLGWNEEDTLKDSTCLRDLTKEHKEDKDDPLLPESFDCMHSIVIGEDQLKTILQTDTVSIPRKFSEIQLNYTREQKLELYNYVIYNTGKISEPELKVSVSNENQSGNDMTFAEIVAKAKKKDKKLKRKYRTSKPTHIEEVRNLVHLQMQALAQYFNPKSSTSEREVHSRCRNKDIERSRRRSRSRSRKRGRSPHFRRKSRNRSTDRRNQSRETGNRSKDMTYRSKNVRYASRSRSRSKDRKIRDKDTESRSTIKRRTHSKSPIMPSSQNRTFERSTSRRNEKHAKSSTKKTKKHSRSKSKPHHKSSKSKKNKHKHREQKVEKQE